ncbi:MAG: class I SAM-dependent methyltransferase [Tumebacillaceae bacterium]
MAIAWWNARKNKAISNAVLHLVRSHSVDQPTTILEIGCGEGDFLQMIHEAYANARLLGLETDPQLARHASRLPIQAGIYVNRVEDVPLNDQSVDLVVSLQNLHAWESPVKGIREVMRVLRPGGLFIIADRQAPPIDKLEGEGFKIVRKSRHLASRTHLVVCMVKW